MDRRWFSSYPVCPRMIGIGPIDYSLVIFLKISLRQEIPNIGSEIGLSAATINTRNTVKGVQWDKDPLSFLSQVASMRYVIQAPRR